jgi:hypothetical protein
MPRSRSEWVILLFAVSLIAWSCFYSAWCVAGMLGYANWRWWLDVRLYAFGGSLICICLLYWLAIYTTDERK